MTLRKTDHYVNARLCLSFAALHAGPILANMLPKSEVFASIRYTPYVARFFQFAKIKEGISPLKVRLLFRNNIHVPGFFHSVPVVTSRLRTVA